MTPYRIPGIQGVVIKTEHTFVKLQIYDTLLDQCQGTSYQGTSLKHNFYSRQPIRDQYDYQTFNSQSEASVLIS